jgi:hypothetical protein
MTIAELIAKAQVGVVIEGHTYYSANHEFANGGVLFCSLQYRSANSRGANRGKGRAVVFNYAAPGEKYSKRISKEKAAELMK